MVRGVSKRDPKIAKRIRRGEAIGAVADRYDLTPARVGQIARAAGVETPRAGRKPTGAATHHTARGRALLAQLVEDAAAAGVEPEAYLDARRRGGTCPTCRAVVTSSELDGQGATISECERGHRWVTV